ncbi:MAG: DNA-processing protein DprA [Candidatus Marinimicrobia bacterium]|nr:DNA-processing protein DprA [Candidatus Neomarinimicrobiota bacterium]
MTKDKTTEKIFANAFNQEIKIGAVSLKNIKDHFGSFEGAWKAPFFEIKKLVKNKKLEEFRHTINPEKEFEKLEKENIKTLLFDELPKMLQEIYSPPELLYAKGTLPSEDSPHIAIVGPRKFSTYGKESCKKIVEGLSRVPDNNFVVVSGMASGIDTIAHKTAIDNNMKTIAVLGCGLHENVLFPSSNKKLYREILEKDGVIISEYPLYMRAQLFTFPQRNRIVAGLSKATLVIEAPQRSGSLITASMALENNRDVFAVPGGIFSKNAEGVNKLIKEGALPVTNSDDILHAFGIETENFEQEKNFSSEEKIMIEKITEPIQRDELLRKIEMPTNEANSLLVKMEIKGIIKEVSGKIYLA